MWVLTMAGSVNLISGRARFRYSCYNDFKSVIGFKYSSLFLILIAGAELQRFFNFSSIIVLLLDLDFSVDLLIQEGFSPCSYPPFRNRLILLITHHLVVLWCSGREGSFLFYSSISLGKPSVPWSWGFLCDPATPPVEEDL